jgi:hypothetical protein
MANQPQALICLDFLPARTELYVRAGLHLSIARSRDEAISRKKVEKRLRFQRAMKNITIDLKQ